MEIMVEVKQTSETTSEGAARSHRVLCDRPEAKGGADDGPMGGELFLLGLGGCFMSNLLAAVKAREVQATNLGVGIRAVLDDAPPRFSRVDMQVSGDYLDRREMEKLVIIAERGCIVANTIKGAVELHITLA
jgi:putative redox protein